MQYRKQQRKQYDDFNTEGKNYCNKVNAELRRQPQKLS